METKNCIEYFRVSTKHQGEDGLGMAAQKKYVRDFAAARGYTIVGSFHDVESGKNTKRAGLLAAIAESKRLGATILVSKLCRLARNAAFIMTLRDSKVDFIACDMPNADQMTIGLMAVVAQNYRDTVSDNTKRAHWAKRATGWVPQKPVGFTRETALKGAMAVREAARENPVNKMAHAFASDLRKQGMTLEQIAAKLNEGAFPTSKGCEWHKTSVKRVLEMMT